MAASHPRAVAQTPLPSRRRSGAVAAAVQLLADHPDLRVLRRIGETTLSLAADDTDAPTRIGVVVDVETEGLDPARDAIIELAMRRFRFDAAGRIVAVGATRVWREDPGRPLDPAITRLTGLTDADVAGQAIDEAAATAMLRTAAVVVAHNAAFDRPRVETRLPGGAGRPWACSLSEVDWDGLGFEGRRLGHLLMQAGWFHDGHRAEADILALLHLLAHRCPDDTTILGRLIARAEVPTVRVEARGARVRAQGCAQGARLPLACRPSPTGGPRSPSPTSSPSSCGCNAAAADRRGPCRSPGPTATGNPRPRGTTRIPNPAAPGRSGWRPHAVQLNHKEHHR